MSITELAWFKSSYSSGSGDDCVEVAPSPTTIHIRDSKNKQGPHLTVTPDAWMNFISLATHAT
ncbi:DUF397 domain-containing protein [Streptomyces sp. HC307]|uniref:DUF397 domain-containing protein n=1 Tax=Streptomyces flavusporus TaxID=3385496 RepID=UPI0039175768